MIKLIANLLLHKGDAIPLHDLAVGHHKPFVVAEDLGAGIAILLLVGVQHEVALGGIECAISGMTVAVVKTAVRSMPTSSPLKSAKSPVAVASIRVRALQPVTI